MSGCAELGKRSPRELETISRRRTEGEPRKVLGFQRRLRVIIWLPDVSRLIALDGFGFRFGFGKGGEVVTQGFRARGNRTAFRGEMQRLSGPRGDVCQPNRSVGGAPAPQRGCLSLSGEKPQPDDRGDPRMFAGGEFLKRCPEGMPVLPPLVASHVQAENTVWGLDPPLVAGAGEAQQSAQPHGWKPWGNSC
jgi:hypothetical protein